MTGHLVFSITKIKSKIYKEMAIKEKMIGGLILKEQPLSAASSSKFIKPLHG
jgi:hypothetical protein